MSINRVKAIMVAGVFAGLAGCAGTPEAPAVADEVAAAPAHCLLYTGTRIPVPEGQCVAYAGRVFTAEQIRGTNAMSVPEALKQLGAY